MRLIFLLLIGLISTISIAQSENIAINNDGTPPDPSAILDIKSINKGVTFPRMTTEQRNAIETPVRGLIIYNTDSDCLEYYAGLLWFEICGTVAPENTFPTGIYVSLLGDDINGDGTPFKPYKTVEKGLQEMTMGDTLRIAGGSYNENDLSIFQKNNFTIIGGYDQLTWINKETSDTKIIMKANALFKINESNNIWLKDLRIVGNLANANNPSSYGLNIRQSTNIELDSCWVDARNGFNQSAGDDGMDGIGGKIGDYGGNPQDQDPGLGGEIGGGTGGFGDYLGEGQAGQPGNEGAVGGLGGAGTASDGGNGGNGANGDPGSEGTGGASFGVAGLEYTTSDGTDGTDGTDGAGGGGGGGGGGETVDFQDYYGGGGGGGGGGATAGKGGKGGLGGGGSFAIYASNSSVILNNCLITSQKGGDGGNGGTGGLEMTGGDGGIGGYGSGNGGNGGKGGSSGRGGNGGGGGGGPSFALYSIGTSSFTITASSLTHGNAGNGGISPAGGASNGANGISGSKNF